MVFNIKENFRYENIILYQIDNVCDDYGYNHYRFIPGRMEIVGSPETRSNLMLSYAPFYRLENGKIEFLYTIGIDKTTEGEGPYFKSDEDRKCQDTNYENVWWWLRSPGNGSNDAASVSLNGSVSYYGDFVDYDYHAIRPALWVDLSKTD